MLATSDKLIRVALLPILCAALFASCRKEMPAEYRAFFNLPREQQIAQMRKMPTDTQIDYYLAGQEYFGPPLNLDEPIIERGKEAVPFLLNRLKREEKDYQQMFLIYALSHIHRSHYDLNDDKEAIHTLREVSADMEPGFHKENAENVVRDIVENRPPDLDRFKQERPRAFPNVNRQ